MGQLSDPNQFSYVKLAANTTWLKYYTSSSYLPDGTVVKSGAEIGLLSPRLCVSQGASLGDFLFALVRPIEKVALWVGFLYLTAGFENDDEIVKAKVFAWIENRTRDLESKAQYTIH